MGGLPGVQTEGTVPARDFLPAAGRIRFFCRRSVAAVLLHQFQIKMKLSVPRT